MSQVAQQEPGVQCFKGAPEKGAPNGDLSEKTKDEARLSGGGGPKLLCKLCRAPITTRGDAIEVEGKHEHTFFNPAGVLYEIGCFGVAPGCRISGQPTTEFAWFKGHTWQYSSCSSCGCHMGWYFSAGTLVGFHGLITNRLIEEVDSESPQP